MIYIEYYGIESDGNFNYEYCRLKEVGIITPKELLRELQEFLELHPDAEFYKHPSLGIQEVKNGECYGIETI